MYQFFVETTQITEDQIRILGKDVNHMKNVLRMKPGEEIRVTDSETSKSYRCEVAELYEETVVCHILAEEEEGSSYTFEIQAGDSSYQVAYRLQQAGLVADARDFDNYLCSKGYDRKLKTGSYEIPETATEEEISEILCGR